MVFMVAATPGHEGNLDYFTTEPSDVGLPRHVPLGTFRARGFSP